MISQFRHVLLFALVLAAPAGSAVAQERWVWAGEQVARRNCAECHAIGPGQVSPYSAAPTFPRLRGRLDRAQMAKTLKESMASLHPRMPPLHLEPDEVTEFLDFWDSLAIEPEPVSTGHKRAHHGRRASH